MATNPEPVVLELAPLPRDQAGPFVLLGLEKDADKEQLEANWARRLIWARKGQFRIPLEDINWAREFVADMNRRPRADAASLNLDTSEGVLRRLKKQFGGGGTTAGRPGWHPLDVEKELREYTLPVAVPTIEEAHAAIALPVVPDDVPAVRGMLQQLATTPIDPWALPGIDPGPSGQVTMRPSTSA